MNYIVIFCARIFSFEDLLVDESTNRFLIWFYFIKMIYLFAELFTELKFLRFLKHQITSESCLIFLGISFLKQEGGGDSFPNPISENLKTRQAREREKKKNEKKRQ